MQETILRDGEVAIILPSGTQVIMNTKTVPALIKDFLDAFKKEAPVVQENKPEAPKVEVEIVSLNTEVKKEMKLTPVQKALRDMYSKVMGSSTYANMIFNYPHFVVSSDGYIFNSMRAAEDFYKFKPGSISKSMNSTGYQTTPIWMGEKYICKKHAAEIEELKYKTHDNILRQDKFNPTYYFAAVNCKTSYDQSINIVENGAIGFVIFGCGQFMPVAARMFSKKFLFEKYLVPGTKDEKVNRKDLNTLKGVYDSYAPTEPTDEEKIKLYCTVTYLARIAKYGKEARQSELMK